MDEMGGNVKLSALVKKKPHIRVAQATNEASGFTGYKLGLRMGKAMFWQKKLE